MSPTLPALEARIARIAADPARIDAGFLLRIARPLLTAIGYTPSVRVEKVRVLLHLLQWTRTPAGEAPDDASAPPPEAPHEAFEAAVRELDANVTSVERAAVLARCPMVAHAAWLGRLHGLLVQVERAMATSSDVALLRVAAGVDPVALLPPLSMRAKADAPDEADREGHAVRAPKPIPDDLRRDARIVGLELAAVDHMLAAARGEREVLARKRRLLEAARQLLIEAAAAIPLENDGVRARHAHIAREILRIDRLEAAGVQADVGLTHQLRQCVARGERQRAYATVAALDGAALASGDAALGRLTTRALERLWGGAIPASQEARQESVRRSGRELLGREVLEIIDRAHEAGRFKYESLAEKTDGALKYEYQEALRHLARGAAEQVVFGAMAVGGCFELGGTTNPVRIVEETRRLRAVRFPTQSMILTPAQDVTDIRDGVVRDPRTILLDLAAGRLLTRRFVREEVTRHPRTVMRSEVRVYVLDGSGSMLGSRGRMRDAILTTELAALMARLSEPGDLRCTLFYRFFNEKVGPTTRVDSLEGAKRSLIDVLSTSRTGGTDITEALLASFEQVRDARAGDPGLVRAQVVLVTDGEAWVDEAQITAARESVGDLPVGVSVIALGQENPALRGIVARQRARGERAFYHFVDDATLEAIAKGELDTGPPIHFLTSHDDADLAAVAKALEGELGPLVDEMESLGRQRDLHALERLDDEAQARREVGLGEREALTEGELARVESLHRDRRSLTTRFARWFPLPKNPVEGDVMPAAGTPERDDLDAVKVALGSVVEVIRVVGGSDLARRADAIDLLERLLPDAGITPARYHETLRAHGHHLRAALQALHDAVQSGR